MNTMGCSFLLMAAVALVVGFIPILTWINLFVALPLAAVGMVSAGLIARKSTAQPADKTMFRIAIALTATILLRMVNL